MRFLVTFPCNTALTSAAGSSAIFQKCSIMKQREIVAPAMPLTELNVQRPSKASVSPAPQLLVGYESAVMLPLGRLKIHPFNSRARRTQARIEEVRDMLIADNTQAPQAQRSATQDRRSLFTRHSPSRRLL